MNMPNADAITRIVRIKEALENYVHRMTMFGMCVECDRKATECVEDVSRECGCPGRCDVSEARRALRP